MTWYMEQKEYRDIVEGRAPAYFEQEFAFWEEVRQYGVENLIIRQQVNLYRQYLHPIGDPYTLVEDLAPKVGGDRAGISLIQKMQKRLGYRIGLYTNYTLIPPLSYRSWDEDLVCLRPDGQWKIGSLASYLLKPSRARELQQRFNSKLKAKFNPTASYAYLYNCRPGWACPA